MIFSEKNTPRWIVFFIDIFICLFSISLSYLLRFNFSIPQTEIVSFNIVFPFILSVRLVIFYFLKTYAGIVRYTSTKDAQRIFLAVGIGSVFFAIFNIITFYLKGIFLVPYSIVIIDFITTIFIMTSSRLLVKVLYLEFKNPTKTKTNVIIYGAGESGIITKRTLDRDAGTKYKVKAFIDDDKNKVGKKLEGVTIYNAKNDLEELLKDNTVAHLIISIQSIHPKTKQEIAETCLNYNTKILNVPPVENWINGQLSFKQIKKIKIEDLLEREPIKLNTDIIKKQISGKRVLITGAAGSIGSEIVRQIISFSPDKIILLDQAESPLYDIELELQEKRKFKNVETVIGDIKNIERMKNLFNTFRPEIVYHAAAYKHVPMMENNPSESILTNVCGTKIIADLSIQFNVETFVMVSTDKAVNPTNIMGATKRIAEIYIQALNKRNSSLSLPKGESETDMKVLPLGEDLGGTTTKFITTRFGNVLGSNGSVIPRFKKQIDEGGPITVTHPDITRYFMTIPEACQLVLEAGAMGKGGEIFIFDMGNSVRVADLAKKMVRLSGLTLGKDIQLVYTGLRPGEKLYEELLNDHENTIPTHHPKIMVAKVKEYDFEIIAKEISELIDLFNTQNNEAIVKKMKHIVPEFKSNNSVYEQLDSTNN